MSEKPYRVYYDLAYDVGEGRWHKDYRTRWGAGIARLWNLYVASWGGAAELSRRTDRIAAQAVAEDAAYRSDPCAYMRNIEGCYDS